MGNCLRHESSSMHWGGDDWGSPVRDRILMTNTRQEVQEKVMVINTNYIKEEREEDHESSCTRTASRVVDFESNRSLLNSNNNTIKEVKIKISKTQLEDLLGKVNMKELSVEQVLADLISSSDVHAQNNQSFWKPNLQSIPE